MKATITTWVKTEHSQTTKEFKNFEEFKSYDFTPNNSISLYTGDMEERYLHLIAFPDRTLLNTSNFEYTVTLILYKPQRDIKLIPKGTDLNTVKPGDSIYVTKELMLEAVAYFFKNDELNPDLHWHIITPVNLTDAERENMNREMTEYFEKYGDPFNGEPLQ